MERFHWMWEAMKQHRESLWSHPSLIRDQVQELADARNVPITNHHWQAEEAVESEMKAMFMLARENKARHQNLCNNLKSPFTVGSNKYPSNTLNYCR